MTQSNTLKELTPWLVLLIFVLALSLYVVSERASQWDDYCLAYSEFLHEVRAPVKLSDLDPIENYLEVGTNRLEAYYDLVDQARTFLIQSKLKLDWGVKADAAQRFLRIHNSLAELNSLCGDYRQLYVTEISKELAYLTDQVEKLN